MDQGSTSEKKAGKVSLRVISEYLFELVYPSNIYCISCGNLIDSSRPYALCDSCVRTLKWASGRTCDHCGKPLQENYLPALCVDCLDTEHDFEKGYTCVEYGMAERDLLLRFKYREEAYLGRKMAILMYERLQADNLTADLIVPVPMYAVKQKKRGYNQAAVLAENLSKLAGIPCAEKILKRSVKTEAMSGLGVLGRRQNMEKVFSVSAGQKETLYGKRVLLIDDIYTTGSTADACARTLRDAGAKKVFVITFAAGANLLRRE